MYVSITEGQPTTNVIGNTGSMSFPLIAPLSPVYGEYLNCPIRFMEGNNVWNSAKYLNWKVETFNTANPPILVPAIFSLLTMLFEYDDTVYLVQEEGKPGKWPPLDHKGTIIDQQNLNVFYDKLPFKYFQ